MKEDIKVASVLHYCYRKAQSTVQEKAIASSFIAMVQRQYSKQRALRIISLLEKMLEKDEGILTASVTTAIPLSNIQKTTLITTLQQKFSAQAIHLNESIDPAVIGGIAITMDDMLYDATVRNTLHTLHNTLQQS